MIVFKHRKYDTGEPRIPDFDELKQYLLFRLVIYLRNHVITTAQYRSAKGQIKRMSECDITTSNAYHFICHIDPEFDKTFRAYKDTKSIVDITSIFRLPTITDQMQGIVEK